MKTFNLKQHQIKWEKNSTNFKEKKRDCLSYFIYESQLLTIYGRFIRNIVIQSIDSIMNLYETSQKHTSQRSPCVINQKMWTKVILIDHQLLLNPVNGAVYELLTTAELNDTLYNWLTVPNNACLLQHLRIHTRQRSLDVKIV